MESVLRRRVSHISFDLIEELKLVKMFCILIKAEVQIQVVLLRGGEVY